MKILSVGNGTTHADSYPTPNVGGSVQTWGISKELAKKGHEVYILMRSDTKGEETIEKVNLVRINFKGLDDLTRIFSHLYSVGALISRFYFSKESIKEIIGINPDIVCLIDRFSGIFPARLNIPKIYVLHLYNALDFFRAHSIHAHRLNSILFYVSKIAENSVMREVDKTVVLNSYIEEHLRTKGVNNIVRIPNGVDSERYANEGDENYLLYSGRFDWNKHVETLVEAFSLLDRKNGFKLKLVGHGPREEHLKGLVKSKGMSENVDFTPFLERNKFVDELAKCSIFVLPSLFECMPVIVLEAMASSKPVVARNIPGPADIITHGHDGLLFRDRSELRACLELLLSDSALRKKLGNNARKTIEQKYTFERIASSYEKLYKSLLSN